jgi:hypothetical protein
MVVVATRFRMNAGRRGRHPSLFARAPSAHHQPCPSSIEEEGFNIGRHRRHPSPVNNASVSYSGRPTTEVNDPDRSVTNAPARM